ncbi:MAG TPA: hypothetical protein VFF89_10215 [Sphingobium sp.]|nr:hypothetical protein [Sphingobium sp.]
MYEGSRKRAAYGVAGCLIAILVGWLIAHSDGTSRTPASVQHAVGWLTIILFGLFGLMSGTALLVPPRLWIEKDGFTFKTPWREKKYRRWQDINEIWVLNQQRISFVVWTTNAQSGGLTRSTFGYDETLRGGWAASAEEIAYELNVAKERFCAANRTVS